MTAQEQVLEAVRDPGCLRDCVAAAYRAAIDSPETVDWGTVNRAIIERWSRSGLSYVKKKAWGSL